MSWLAVIKTREQYSPEVLAQLALEKKTVLVVVAYSNRLRRVVEDLVKFYHRAHVLESHTQSSVLLKNGTKIVVGIDDQDTDEERYRGQFFDVGMSA